MAQGSSTRATAAGQRTSIRWFDQAMRSCPRFRSGRAPATPAPPTSTAPRSAHWPRGRGVSRVLLTHLGMGMEKDATIELVCSEFNGQVELVEPGLETTLG